MKVYGCKAYFHIPIERQIRSEKFVPRGKIGKLVGYTRNHIYKIWDPETDRVVVTSSVTFDEAVIQTPQELLHAVGLTESDEFGVISTDHWSEVEDLDPIEQQAQEMEIQPHAEDHSAKHTDLDVDGNPTPSALLRRTGSRPQQEDDDDADELGELLPR